MQALIPKDQIAAKAYSAAMSAMKNTTSCGYASPNSMMGQLTDMVAIAIQAAIAETLKNLYTNDDFERDIGLNK